MEYLIYCCYLYHKAEFIGERKAFFHRFLAWAVLFFDLKNKTAHENWHWAYENDEKHFEFKYEFSLTLDWKLFMIVLTELTHKS